ncbi:class I SAM-dependent methyltransferase [Shewanella sp. D64]|uniref:class I SAM-dependent methyltransferase n=1 Tax=unclassified Shewanella TaxID=196818 RepID=UPI0022BA4C12|nr:MULTISPECIES: class I SAM-dependent methyltransferase [unclassified Shewanella]MEC4726917.1 class I SAM-dependent methyltransferase [Shewanella sp. D64]MEC4738586.1 class I SAM-dependent methyltransferase [Shewanella sp. E94]WBJ93804.1 class I SAM-dependent methyltransferase [Shewanella sp. MTB7]
MATDNLISQHYTHGKLLEAIQGALLQQGHSIDKLTSDDIAPVDEFHIGGRLATEHLFAQINFTAEQHILDVGCGLGGTARYIASQFNNRVTGIDLTAEYIETGRCLSQWVGLDKQVSLCCGNALSMAFDDEAFDGASMFHVGMNIQDKVGLFREVYRVLKPISTFVIYDIMRMGSGELLYPVPWATDVDCSHVSTLEHYQLALTQAGFEVHHVDNRGVFALEFFSQMKARNQTNGGLPPLGLHTLMGRNTVDKIGNMLNNIRAGYIAPVELIAYKK